MQWLMSLGTSIDIQNRFKMLITVYRQVHPNIQMFQELMGRDPAHPIIAMSDKENCLLCGFHTQGDQDLQNS